MEFLEIMDLKTAGVIIVLTIPFVLLTLWAIVNAAGKEFASTGLKAFWLLVAAIPFVGFIIYFIFGARRGRKPGGQTAW